MGLYSRLAVPQNVIMNPSIAFPQGFSGTGEQLAFLSFPSAKAKRQLPGSTDEAVRNIAAILDQLLTTAIETRTAAEFIALRDAAFPTYTGVMVSLATLVQCTVPKAVRESLTAQSLCEQEAEFRDRALSAFGSAIQDQALFTVWTLRKINDLAQRISAAQSLADRSEVEDLDAVKMFAFHGLRTRFHLDCLTASMRHDRAIFPEVLSTISDGLRSAVDAYAWIRKIFDSHHVQEGPILEFIDLDEEDTEFINASGRNLGSECLAES
jgi:hypothetical protein